eukprot:363403-Chlamydomonas_euryale.AAC.23
MAPPVRDTHNVLLASCVRHLSRTAFGTRELWASASSLAREASRRSGGGGEGSVFAELAAQLAGSCAGGQEPSKQQVCGKTIQKHGVEREHKRVVVAFPWVACVGGKGA